MGIMSDRYFEHGLWEQAAEYEGYSRAADPDGRVFRCLQAAVLSLAHGDIPGYRAITQEAIDRLGGTSGFWFFRVLQTATLSPETPIPPEKLVTLAERLVAEGKNDSWFTDYKITLGLALLRAGRYDDALGAIQDRFDHVVAKPAVALVHARANRPEQARLALQAASYQIEYELRDSLVCAARSRPRGITRSLLIYADILRREAHALLNETAPELPNLRLLRGDALWRLNDQKHALAEFAAAVANAPDTTAALLERARTFENLGLFDRALADFDEAIHADKNDPRPWIARGRLFARRGDGSAADEAFSRTSALAQAGLTRSSQPAGGSQGHTPAR